MNFNVILIPFWLILCLIRCVPRRRESDVIQKFHRTGEAIAVDDLIRKYEQEHKKLYGREINGGDHLRWPALDSKDLSEYCRKYLHHTVPNRTTYDATGIKIRNALHYEKEHNNTISKIVMVQCKVRNKHYQLVYYLTRALEPSCVYALKSIGYRNDYTFNIINKYCDFEKIQIINMSLKWKRAEIVSKMHRYTGQPIAKDEYLLKYEMEHKELLKKDGDNYKRIKWLFAIKHPNLSSYCYQYMEVSAPSRHREDVMGNWKIELLYYQKMNTNNIVMITTIKCQIAHASKQYYLMTRALEINCVYALLRQGRSVLTPLVIIYKHCDFEKDQQSTPVKDFIVQEKDVIPKAEVKEEVLEPLQLLPSN